MGAWWNLVCVALAFALTGASAQAQTPTSLWFFGDSLTDEGRNGRTALYMWPEALRADFGVSAGYNYAIGGATTSNQPSSVFGNSSFLGQVNSFVAASPATGANPLAAVWIGTNNIWIGSAHGSQPANLAASTSADVLTGLAALAGAGVRNVDLLGVYDLSLTNAYELAGANTPAVRAAAATASQLYNASLVLFRSPATTSSISTSPTISITSSTTRNPTASPRSCRWRRASRATRPVSRRPFSSTQFTCRRRPKR